MSGWQPIETAPKDGTRILARESYIVGMQHRGPLGLKRWLVRRTFWGKTSHVPLYGWNWGRDVEDLNLWNPTQWKPLPDPPQ